MNTRISFFITLVALSFSASVFAQNNILLKINHKLFTDDFALYLESASPQGEAFELDRLEYYISEISVTHDGGMVTSFDDLWLLVDASSATNEVLGQAAIDSVESISMHIGVDETHNHLDPSSWPSSHPLYHQSPSMHWGWTAGYRFVAMEGVAGENLNQVFEVHALGDNNYFETTVDVSAGASGSNVVIELFADYTQALMDVSVESGVISHGATGISIDVLENFRDYVFSDMAPVDTADTTPVDPTGIADLDLEQRIKLYPNPSTQGVVNIHSIDASMTADLAIYNLMGKLVKSDAIRGNQVVQIADLAPGMYTVRVQDHNSNAVELLKLIVQ